MKKKTISVLGIILSLMGVLSLVVSLFVGISMMKISPGTAAVTIFGGFVMLILFFAIAEIVYQLKRIGDLLENKDLKP